MKQLPPHSTETERALLSAWMLDADAFWRTGNIPPDAFYEERHQVIARGIASLSQDGKPADLVILAQRLQASGELHKAGGYSYLMEVAQAGIPAHAEAYREELMSLYQRRRLLRAAMQITEKARDLTQDIDTCFAALSEAVEDTASERMDMVTAVEAVDEWVDSQKHGARLSRIPTGLETLDAVIGGLPKGELTVLAAATSMGKSALALQTAYNVAKNGGRVVLFTPEMSRAQVASRFVARLGGHGETARRRIRQEIGDRLLMDDTGFMTVPHIQAQIRRYASRQPIDLIVVDHLQHLRDKQGRNESRNDLVGRQTGTLKALAREENAAMLLLSQLNRDVAKGADREPQLHHLRDSGNIEQDAEIVMFLYRQGYYAGTPDDPRTTIFIRKNRNGPVTAIPVIWQPQRVCFKDYEPKDQGGMTA